jgi:hypothetical protein
MVTVDFNVDPVGQIDVDEVVDKLESERFDEVTDEELRAFVRLMTESEAFSPGEMRSGMKEQMPDFLDAVSEATDRRTRRAENLND